MKIFTGQKTRDVYVFSLLYLSLGVLWIVISDLVMNRLSLDKAELTNYQTIKGIIFVVLTTLLFHLLLLMYYKSVETAKKEKETLFRETMGGAMHILNTFLNNMVYFKTRAEESDCFSKEDAEQFEDLIHQTSTKVTELAEIEEIGAEEVHRRVQKLAKEGT